MIKQDMHDFKLQIAESALLVHIDYWEQTRCWNTQRHCNVDFEIHVLLSGSCTLDIEDSSLPFRAGEVVMIGPGCYHFPHNVSGDLLRLSFSFTVLSSPLKEQLHSCIRNFLQQPLSEEAVSLCGKILDEIRQEGLFSHDLLTGMFTQLFARFFRELPLGIEALCSPNAQAVTVRNAIIDQFFEASTHGFGTEKELTELLHISRRQLNRILTTNYGMGFRQKMYQTRMEYATSLLLTTNKSAGEIGLLSGYTEESSFFKAFQSYYHMTPQQYRARARKKSGR